MKPPGWQVIVAERESTCEISFGTKTPADPTKGIGTQACTQSRGPSLKARSSKAEKH